MAYKIGLIGLPNSGKSYSRSFIKKGEEVFILSPSHKATYLTDSEGHPVKALEVGMKTAKSEFSNLEEVQAALGISSKHETIKRLAEAPKDVELRISGNYAVCSQLNYVPSYLKFVSEKMPHIKTIVLADFTHWINYIIASENFRNRKSGGEAYAR